MTDPTIEIVDHPDLGRYVLTVDGEPAAFVAYRDRSDRRIIDHTEVDPAFGGRGLGGRLARHILDHARARQVPVVPRCRFFAGYLERHPEDHDLVAPAEAG